MWSERRVPFSFPAIALATVGALGCGKGWGGRCASDDDCFFSRDEWTLIRSLANVSSDPPPTDDSNELLVGLLDQNSDGVVTPAEAKQVWDGVRSGRDPLPDIVRLGWRLYYDTRLSGDGDTPTDSAGRATPPPRHLTCGQLGQLEISCASCHDPARYGADFTSMPPNVSNGAGYYDVNGQQTLNAARFFPVFYWNGRADSLWSQAAQVMESKVSMHGTREKTLWLMSQCYAGDINLFADTGNPDAGTSTDQASIDHVKIDDIQAVGSSLLNALLMLASTPATATIDNFKTAFMTAQAENSGTKEVATLAERVHRKVAKAIAAYEWFLSSDTSRFDDFVGLGSASPTLTGSEKRGLKLFIGHAGCVNCHNTSLFSDRKFHNIGIGQSGDHVPTVAVCTDPKFCDCRPPDAGAPDVSDASADTEGGIALSRDLAVGGPCLPAGAYSGMQKLHADNTVDKTPPAVFRRCSDRYGCAVENGPNDYPDAGLGARPDPRWLGAWRTPSLRDVAMTAPYMHDGSLTSLSDVVWHYDQAASDVVRNDDQAVSGEGMGTSELVPLNLTDQDRADLVAFLTTLTGKPGPSFLVSPPDPEPSCFAGDRPDGGPVCPPDAGADAGTDAQ